MLKEQKRCFYSYKLHHTALMLTGILFLELSISTLCFTITVSTPEEQRSACWAAAQTHSKCNVLTPWVQSLSNRRVSQSVLLTLFPQGRYKTSRNLFSLKNRKKVVFLQFSVGLEKMYFSKNSSFYEAFIPWNTWNIQIIRLLKMVLRNEKK